MAGRLEGKRVLVTQANDFMGPITVEVFGEEGASVVDDTRDLTVAGACEAAVAEAGEIDVLVANLASPTFTGIATQDPEHEKRYKPDLEAQNIHRFFESVRWQIAAITHALGHDDVRKLGRDDLVALTPEAASITGLPYEPEHRDETDAIAIKAS